MRLGNDLSETESEESENEQSDNDSEEAEGQSDDDDDVNHSTMGESLMTPTNNRNFKAYRDASQKPKKPKAKTGLDEDAIKEKVTRALKGQESRQTGKHHSRRNLIKGKEKRKNKDIIKHARGGNGSIFD